MSTEQAGSQEYSLERRESCEFTKGRYAGGGTLTSVAQLAPADLLKSLSAAIFKEQEDIVVNLFVMML